MFSKYSYCIWAAGDRKPTVNNNCFADNQVAIKYEGASIDPLSVSNNYYGPNGATSFAGSYNWGTPNMGYINAVPSLCKSLFP